jgi:hypothetical protein
MVSAAREARHYWVVVVEVLAVALLHQPLQEETMAAVVAVVMGQALVAEQALVA